MRPNNRKSTLKTAVLAVTILLLGVGVSAAQQQVNLTAGPSSITMPDGSTVPMWGYSCGAAVSGSTATCAALNPAAAGWSPVVITVPTTATGGLAINLTNNLPSPVPTSLVIVGQLGGGLGNTATLTDSPSHAVQGATWPIVGDTNGATFTPPQQGKRVQSFSTEVAPGTTTLLPPWASLRPGTYLIESGTHPSIQGAMGLYGILVVTTPAGLTAGTAYPGVNYNADVPLLFSEIDSNQNSAVAAAVATSGFSETAARVLRDSVSSVTLAVDANGNVIAGAGGSGYSHGNPITFLPLSACTVQPAASVDTVDGSGAILTIAVTNSGSGCTQVPAATATTGGSGANLVAGLSLAGVMCSDGAAACYPPAVNYTPLYYLINGVAFNKTNAPASLFAASPGSVVSPVSGSVLVRMVNAGLRMHVPSIVGAQTGTGGNSGFSLIAEDGNPLPGATRVQSEVFMAAGKTYDVMVNVPAASSNALPVFDRQLSLSGNAIARDAGMLAYIGINGSGLPAAGALGAAVANPDTYNSVIAGQTLAVSDPAKGVLANDFNVYGAKVVAGSVTGGTLTLNTNGTFTFVATAASGGFQYCGNGATSGPACAAVTLGAATIESASGITCANSAYASNVANSLSIKAPGILGNCKDAAGYPLTVAAGSVTGWLGTSLAVDPQGGFNASVPSCSTTTGCIYTFSFQAKNSQGTAAIAAATVTLTFPAASGLVVSVLDGNDKKTPITDYRWIIEEDRTFYIDPTKTANNGGSTIVPTFGTNFHTSYMPVVAAGCVGPTGAAMACEAGQTVYDAGTPCIGTNNPVGCSPTAGQHVPAVCDVGNGVCRPGAQQTPVDPSQVYLDPTKRYYISVLPGDAANPFNTGNAVPGHGMGGAPITFGQKTVIVLAQPTPFPPSKLSVFVFEDDFPLNGEQDAGGGIDVLASNEPGLGGFNITLFDDAGGTGDATGQMTYDMFNQPLSNSLAGTIDPATGLDACPISTNSRIGTIPDPAHPGQTLPDLTQTGITGTIVTCPKYEAGGTVLSPLAGQAVIANLMPGRYGVVATPGADRIHKGEEWLQTNTLDGQKAHDSFLRIGEPSYFQEFGPAGYHVTIGFANPAIINSRKAGVCAGTDPNLSGTNCTNTVKGIVTTERMSRTPDERLYSSGDNSSFAFTQCFVSFGDTDGEDFAFTKCNADGTFSLSGLPDGSWRITVFDQWNDMLVDGLSTPVLLGGGATTDMGEIAMNQWQANIYTSTFFDNNGTGVMTDHSGTPCTAPNTPVGCNANFGTSQPGLTLVATNIRFRDGSYSNFNNTDLSGNAGFNEVFPLFSWYVVETDSTRYKNTGVHVVYDAGGPADGTTGGGSSSIGGNLANTAEQIHVPASLRVPGARYCASADCPAGDTAGGSTGRVDPAWVTSEGWQGFSGQNSFLEFGKKPYAVGETGGIHGEVIYASTRPFDDPALLIHTSWTPDVPGVTINLYQEGTAPDGSISLKLVDTTKTSSWDDWAQGFRSDGNGGLVPNMSCPGQGTASGTNADLFYFTLFNQPMWLDVYNNGGTPAHTIPNNSQFKCYDGMHNWNQLQPAPYDGYYTFPSVTSMDPTTGAPTGTNCTACIPNPDTTDSYRHNTPMLSAGKYVVEVVVPPGYELVKEEDKNILIGDNYIAPVTQQFGGLGNIFILPDQAEVASAFNANNPQNPTNAFGRTTLPSHEGDTGSVETFWPCVGAARIVPDFISLFPQSAEVAPFAGATRNLCDRKEVTLEEQSSALAKFWIFTSAHVAAHFTGVITDDFTSEFDPFSPQFGEKFSPPNLPISFKDWTGNEVSRVYTDQWGTYNGLTYSTWEVNPPNPTGYAPTMMVVCMNDPGTGATPDALFNPQYSQFCYEIPFMPGQTQYMDTPVVPTSAFAGAGYNNPDCSYPDATPAISEVDGDGIGPWVSAPGSTLTIKALSNQDVYNNGYSGPSATTAPFNQKKVTRHYGFGGTAGTVALVGSDGVAHPLTGVMWGDATITGAVPSGVPACAMQQQNTPPGTTIALCGELVITTASGKKSVDSVTVTIGGKAPSHVTAGGTIQSAIDAAMPGDLIMVDPGTYNELLLMWKPVRLQGAGAASSVINANSHPAGKLDPWRRQVVCLFGLAVNGQPFTAAGGTNPYDVPGGFACPGTGWTGYNGGPNNPQVDRLPLEGMVGWDTTVNGNLAQLLQEPTLMGAYEGAGITVLAKGVRYPAGVEIFGHGPDTGTVATESQMPLGTVLLTDAVHAMGDVPANSADCTDYPSNFQCNPSRIDGLSITNSSQGGGGIFVHAWGHNLEISNNRITNNSGTQSGGINVGQGETPDALLVGNNGDPQGFDQAPGSCVSSSSLPTNLQLPYCYNTHLNVHNNAITLNSSIGDELFSATPAGAGAITFDPGSDFYQFNYNWVCGNLSTGDGGGFTQLGFTWQGDIEHNSILFNQSTNPTIPTNGGGIAIVGAAPDGQTVVSGNVVECGSVTDVDCVPGLSDGTGPGLVINANLIMGNAAESGSGGGIRFQAVNGTEVARFPRLPQNWYSVSVTNNIITNNVAGWDGAGVSLQDALVVNITNNTIASNDSTASAGVLFNTLGAPLASSPGSNCIQPGGTTSSCPQPAGLVAVRNSAPLTASLTGVTVTCPAGYHSGGTGAATNGTCRIGSFPLLSGNVFWQNRSFYIGVGSLGAGTLNQQNVVALFNAFGTTRAASQLETGACVSPASYWDIGVRGDTGPADHSGGFTLAPTNSVLTRITGGYAAVGAHNTAANPLLDSPYCNGSRVPPEFKSAGYQVPPGIADATVPNPIFNLTPSATVDEGNNWINIGWGPLAMTNPVTGATLGSYSLAVGSPAIDYIPTSVAHPSTDFFGNPRPDPTAPASFDVGAVEFQGVNGAPTAPTLTSITPNTGTRGTIVSVTLAGTNLDGASAVTVSGTGVTCTVTGWTSTAVNANCTITTTAALGARNVSVTTPAGTSNPVTFTVVTPTLTSITPASGVRGTIVPVTIAGANLTGATAVTVSGAGVTVSAFTLVDSSTITATFTISATAAATVRTVSVVTPSGTIGGLTFTVLGPTLSSISPNTGLRGTNVPVTLTGTNLTGATAVNVSGTLVNASSFTVVNSTQITATITIGPTAALGDHTVTVVTPIGTTNAVTFTVIGPTLTSIAPTTGVRGGAVPVTLTGTNLTGATAVTVSGAGVTVSGVTVNSTTITATFTLTAGAALTARNVTVTIPGGAVTNAVTFTVLGATVSFSAPSPLMNGGGLSTKNATITVTNTATGANAGSLTLTAAPGFTRTGGTGTGTFTIQPGGTCVSGAVVAPNGGTCTINVRYVPTTTTNATYTVNVTGIGANPATQTSSAFTVN